MAKITVQDIEDLGFTADMFNREPNAQVKGDDGLNYTCKSPHASSAATKPVTGASWSSVWYLGGRDGAEWVTDTGYEAQFYTYLEDIIDDQAADLEALITTDTYNDTDTLTARRVKKAELYLTAAELTERRINKQLGNVIGEGIPISTKSEREQMTNYREKADELIAILRGDTDFSFATVKTSHFNDEDDS